MDGVSLFVGVCFPILFVDGSQDETNVKLEKLTNVITLTADNIDERIANKHHLVLFYGARYVRML